MLVFKLILAGLSCGLLFHNYIATHHPSAQAKIAGYVVVIFTVISFLVDAHIISTDNFFGTESSKKQQPSQYENTQSSNDYSNSNQTSEVVQQTYSEPSPVDNTVKNEPAIKENITPSIETTDILLDSGEWRDPATGLIWMRCSLGQTWENGNCTGVADKLTWSEAVNSAGIADGKNWRLPTIEEWKMLSNVYPVDLFPSKSIFWSSSPVDTNVAALASIAGFYDGRPAYGSDYQMSTNYVRLIHSDQ